MNSRSDTSPNDLWVDVDGDSAVDHYRQLVDLVDARLFQLDQSGRFVAVNDAMLRVTGYSRGDLFGRRFSTILADGESGHGERRIEESLELTGVTTFECVVKTGDSGVYPCEVRVSRGDEVVLGVLRERPSGPFAALVGDADDPAEPVSTILDKVDGGIFLLDDEFDIVWADETIGQYFGVDPSSLYGQDKRHVVEEVMRERVADPEKFAERLRSAYDENTSVEQFTCEVTAGEDREHRWLDHWSQPIESGQFAGGRLEIYTEVTDRREASEALQETEEQFSSLVDAVEEYAIFRLDREGRVESWNAGARKIKGYEAEEILGEHISTFYTESERAVDVPEWNLAAALEAGSVEDEGWRVRKDGSRFWANVTITAIHDDAGHHRGYLKVTRDTTDRHDREQKLESELHRILDRISDGFYAVDEQWRFTHVNERAEELLQHDRAELLGEVVWNVFPEARETIIWDRFHEAMDEQESVSFHLEFETLDIWVEATAYPSASGLSVYFRDITDRLAKQRQIQHREQQLSEYKEYTDEILDSLDDIFYVVDETGTFQRWNESFSDVTGYSDEEIASMGPPDFVAPEDHEIVATGIQTIFDSGSTRIEARILTEDGREIPMEFAASAVETPDGETVLAGIGRDITDRLEREQALEESNERLEQFAHAASHDLQEPLRMVSSYLRLIERRYEDALDEDGREFLRFAVDGADRMREMIDGLLEYSRIESRGSPFEPVELDQVLDDAREDLRVAIEESNAEVTSDPLPRVDGDRSQLRQLFQNLLDNAIEYNGDEPPKIHLTANYCPAGSGVEHTAENDDEWVVSVRDEGVGIALADQDRVFRVFQSLDGPDEHGSGIGLALCKRIVERHGGDIWVDSAPGEGTTVSFTIPNAEDDDD